MSKQKSKHLEVEQVRETEITSLNENLLNEFSIEELEVRYETDPLMLPHLFGIVSSSSGSDVDMLSDSEGCEKCKCYMSDFCKDCTQCVCNDGFSICPELGCGARK